MTADSFPAPDEPEPNLPGVFPDTRWTLVLRAAEAGRSCEGRRALEDLCRTYWRPIYVVSRRHGLSHEDAEDLTQTFFADLITTNSVDRVSSDAGRLRWFLLRSLSHHLSHWRQRATAAKRGGGRHPLHLDMLGAAEFYHLIPADHLTPEVLYDRHWMLALVDRALHRLAGEQALKGHSALFASVEPALTGDGADGSYAEIASRHGITAAAVKMTVLRLRERFRELIRCEVAETVETLEAVEDEIRHLFAAFS